MKKACEISILVLTAVLGGDREKIALTNATQPNADQIYRLSRQNAEK